MSLVVNPYSYFTDTNGNALNGYLYVGEVGKNAENYPIAIFYDALFTTPAPNPLTISAGYIYNGGTIAQIYTSVDYSMVVKKTDGSLVYSSLNETGMTNGAIANIDEMKEFVAPYNNYALNVLGYSEAGDGGGGLFYYDANSTEDDNGGTIIEPTSGSGRWIRVYDFVKLEYFGVVSPDYVLDSNWIWDSTIDKSTANLGIIIDPSVGLDEQGTGSGFGCMVRQYDDAVNVKWFGAVGDYDLLTETMTTNDTQTINDAIDYAIANSRNLYFPQGIYYYAGNKSITVPTWTDFHIFGEGSGPNNSMIVVDYDNVIFDINASTNGSRKFFVHDIRISQINEDVHTNSTLFYVHDGASLWGSHISIERSYIAGFTYAGVHIIKGYMCHIADSTIRGYSDYNYGDPVGSVDDACVRIWGADNSGENGYHWTGLTTIERCLFTGAKFGIHGWGMYHCTLQDVTMENNWVGLYATKYVGDTASGDVKSNKYAVLWVKDCWFEQNALYHACSLNLDESTGDYVDENGTVQTETYLVNQDKGSQLQLWQSHLSDGFLPDHVNIQNSLSGSGTWTPVILRQGTADVIDYTATGTWIRTSYSEVTCYFTIVINSVTSNGTRFIKIDGLPFLSANTYNSGSGSIGLQTAFDHTTGTRAAGVAVGYNKTLYLIGEDGYWMGEQGHDAAVWQAGTLTGTITYTKLNAIY